jgi:hypothetical protein
MSDLNQHIDNASKFQQPTVPDGIVKDQSANLNFALDMAKRMGVAPEPAPPHPPLGHMPIAN